jgi:hypothetical protein
MVKLLMLRARNVGPHPIEVDCLVGKMFIIDRSLKQPVVSDGTYRIKIICMNAVIVDEFCFQGPYFTPTKVGAK